MKLPFYDKKYVKVIKPNTHLLYHTFSKITNTFCGKLKILEHCKENMLIHKKLIH